MTKPRKLIVSLDQTPWYHCYCRAVRRGWLFGVDDLTGNSLRACPAILFESSFN